MIYCIILIIWTCIEYYYYNMHNNIIIVTFRVMHGFYKGPYSNIMLSIVIIGDMHTCTLSDYHLFIHAL